MLDNNEKIYSINKRIEIIDEMIVSCNNDIERIEGGMVDPDYGLDICSKMIESLYQKRAALEAEKDRITTS